MSSRSYWASLIVLCVVLSMFATCAKAADPWTTTDAVLGTATGVSIAADWLQTRQIAKNPDKWYETNKLLGEHPSVSEVNRHFLIYAGTVGLVAHFSPSPIRKALLGGVLVYQIDLVSDNKKLGIEIKF